MKMKRFSRAMTAVLLAALPVMFLVCAKDPTNPLGGERALESERTTNLPSITLSARRFDLSADGVDSVTIRAEGPDAPTAVAALCEILQCQNLEEMYLLADRYTARGRLKKRFRQEP